MDTQGIDQFEAVGSPSFTDQDGDSQMNNTLEGPSTPPSQRLPSDLSPPDSQGGVPLQPSTSSFSGVPALPSGSSGANMNGKRPLDSLDGIPDSDLPTTSNPTLFNNAPNDQTPQPSQSNTHPATGYTWSKPEDAPGYAWQNRKAQDEANRAWENGVVFKDRSVAKRYADPVNMATRPAHGT